MESWYTVREVTCSGHNTYRLVQTTRGRHFYETDSRATPTGSLHFEDNPKAKLSAQFPEIYGKQYRYTRYSYGTEGQVSPHRTFSKWRSRSSASPCYYTPETVGHRVTSLFITWKWPR